MEQISNLVISSVLYRGLQNMIRPCIRPRVWHPPPPDKWQRRHKREVTSMHDFGTRECFSLQSDEHGANIKLRTNFSPKTAANFLAELLRASALFFVSRSVTGPACGLWEKRKSTHRAREDSSSAHVCTHARCPSSKPSDQKATRWMDHGHSTDPCFHTHLYDFGTKWVAFGACFRT